MEFVNNHDQKSEASVRKDAYEHCNTALTNYALIKHQVGCDECLKL